MSKLHAVGTLGPELIDWVGKDAKEKGHESERFRCGLGGFGSPLLCPLFCVSEAWGSSGHSLPWPWVCLVSILSLTEAAAPLPGRPPGCQRKAAEVVGEMESGVSGRASKALRKALAAESYRLRLCSPPCLLASDLGQIHCLALSLTLLLCGVGLIIGCPIGDLRKAMEKHT